jgi:hypothetical protein
MSLQLNGDTGVTFNDASLQGAAASPFTLKNRIINGDMRIDQRNAGASVTPTTSEYTLDRWRASISQSSKYSVQQSSNAPSGFNNSLLITSLSAYSVLAGDFFNVQQRIEGFNVADLGWGTANAQTVTLSFWVRSSLTGTFGGSLNNSVIDRSYPFSYIINSADTWEQKTVTITGDTSGTWLTTNGNGIRLGFSLGYGSTFGNGTAGAWVSGDVESVTGATSVVGTNGATFYITGVQLEQNTSATPFERRLYGQELANCQRYYLRQNPSGATEDMGVGWNASGTETRTYLSFPTTMRIAPTALEQSGTAGDYSVRHGNTATNCSAVPTIYASTTSSAHVTLTVSSGLTTGQGSNLRPVNTNAFLAWSAEL